MAISVLRARPRIRCCTRKAERPGRCSAQIYAPVSTVHTCVSLPPSLAFSSPPRAAGLRDHLRGGKCNAPTPQRPDVCSGPPCQSGAARGSRPAYLWGGIRENARTAWTLGGLLRFRPGVSALRSNETSRFFLLFYLNGPCDAGICSLVVVV